MSGQEAVRPEQDGAGAYVAPRLEDGYTCVITRDGRVLYASRESGIRPLLEILRQGIDVSGGDAADRIVGKAAALLYARMGVARVRAVVMSRSGLSVLESRGIPAQYQTLTDAIVNRRGDGPCPMEQAVADLDDPDRAYAALEARVRELAGGMNKGK